MSQPLKLAYADPPYLGCGKKYPEHPNSLDYNKLGAHEMLMWQMEKEYDGWALSCSSSSLQRILPLAPPRVRVAAWIKPFAAFKVNVRLAYTWEPVIFRPGRDSLKEGAPVGRDHLAERITMLKGLPGAKPDRFCQWILILLGYKTGDMVVDMFPGTGIMGQVLEDDRAQLKLGVTP